MGGDVYDSQTGETTVLAGTHRWSSPCGDLFAAMALAQSDVTNVEKTGINPAFRSKYTKLGDVLEEVRPKFAAQGIAITQMPINGAGNNIGVVTLFAHESGQWIESTLYVSPTKFDAQGAGSVITYLRRYALMAMAGVAPDDDDDGNAAVGRPSESPGKASTARARPPAATAGYTRPQAAPAPSEAKADATQRWKELRDEIDACMTIPAPNGLEGLPGSPAWVACFAKVVESEDSEERGNQVMGLLFERIEKRKTMLLGETEGGY
jgi:hypothetical protein